MSPSKTRPKKQEKGKSDIVPLERKIEQIGKTPLMSSRSLRELIDVATSDFNLSMLMSRVRSEETHRNFFFLHRMDLFGMRGELQFPYFYYCTPPRKQESLPQDHQGQSKALSYVAEREKLKMSDGQSLVMTMLGIRDEDSARRLFLDLADVIAYFVIKLIRSHKGLKELINAESFDFKSMKCVLKDYKDVLDLLSTEDELHAIFKGDREAHIDPAIMTRVERLISQFVGIFQQDVLRLSQVMTESMPNLVLQFHLVSSVWVGHLLRKSGISFPEYVDILDNLHMYKMISNLSAVSWCEECSRENPVYEVIKGQIAPSKLMKNRCLSCGRTQSFSAIYSLDENLKDCILCGDGFLAVYLGWLLRSEGIPFKVGRYGAHSENDFVIEEGSKKVLIEVKMFRTGGDEITVRSQLEGALSQMKKNIAELEKSGFEVDKAILVWNLDNERHEGAIGAAKSKYREMVDRYSIETFDQRTIEKIVETLRS